MPKSTRKTSRKAAAAVPTAVPSTVVTNAIEIVTREEVELLSSIYARLLSIQKAATQYLSRPMTSGEFVLATEIYPAANEAITIIQKYINKGNPNV